MAKSKYKDDYRYERYYGKNGAVRYRTVYVGRHFVYTTTPERLKTLRFIYGAGCLAAWALLIAALFTNGLLGHLAWVLLPLLACVIPLCLLTDSVWRLAFRKEPLIREDSEKISLRIGACCAGLFALAGFSAVSATVTDILILATHRVAAQFFTMPDDILLPVLSALLCALGVWLYRHRGELSTREKTDN